MFDSILNTLTILEVSTNFRVSENSIIVCTSLLSDVNENKLIFCIADSKQYFWENSHDQLQLWYRYPVFFGHSSATCLPSIPLILWEKFHNTRNSALNCLHSSSSESDHKYTGASTWSHASHTSINIFETVTQNKLEFSASCK